MSEKIWNLKNQAHLLNGAERARLIIKDDYQKIYGDKQGFLEEWDRQALLSMTDYRDKEEYDAVWKTYEQAPHTMAAANVSYIRFKYYFEALKKAHLLLNVSPALNCLSKLIEENIANEGAKRDALKVVNMMQVLEADSSDRSVFKDALSFIRGIVPKASEQARRFVSMKKTVDSMNEAMGFNIFISEHYSESCQVFAEEIGLCIREHNSIMKRAGEGMSDLDSYLIPKSTLEPDCDEQ